MMLFMLVTITALKFQMMCIAAFWSNRYGAQPEKAKRSRLGIVHHPGTHIHMSSLH